MSHQVPTIVSAHSPPTAEPPTLLIPVFLTAALEPSVVDSFLVEDATYRTPHSFRLAIITNTDHSSLQATNHSSQPPVQSFTSPFVGQDLYQVNEFFLAHLRPLNQFTYTFFIVLDEYSAEHGSCTVVAAREQPSGRKKRFMGDGGAGFGAGGMDGEGTGEVGEEEDDEEQLAVGLETLRTEFDIARQVITPAELGVSGFLDDRDHMAVYTSEDVPKEF